MSGLGATAHQRLARALGVGLLLAACSVTTGCYYDSRWGQAKASQKRVAQHEMPSQLRTGLEGPAREGTDEPKKPIEQLRIRAYATPHYAAALVDGEAQFRQALEDANPTFAHDLAFRLELTDYRVWTSGTSDDDLSALLTAIRKEDAADDVDWVVVLASPRHMVATSADQLGVGELLGRYLAIRAMSDVDEFEYIEKGFTELSETEKAKLYAARKRHKAATVLLHEIGHTLGMPHELDRHSMMSPMYDKDESAFSVYAARLGRRVRALRLTTPGTELDRNAAQGALNVLHSAPTHTFEPHTAQEVEELLQFRIEQTARHTAALPAQLAPSAAPVRGPAPSAASSTAGLSQADRALFDKARAAQAASQFEEARRIAAPLFETYPKVYAVQDLRCQLAMKAKLSMEEESAECEPLLRLSGSAL